MSANTYESLADLALAIESYELEAWKSDTSGGFTRLSTIVRLVGDRQQGVGEDVTWDPEDQVVFQLEGPTLPVGGSHSLDSFSELLDELDLFPTEPLRKTSRDYRRWAFESAALDLALHQNGLSLAEAIGREPKPVTFVCSIRLGEPPTVDPLRERLRAYPELRFKLDPTSGWDDKLISELVATGAIDVLDFKGMYSGTPVDEMPDAELYRRVAEGFPEAWLEDPYLDERTSVVLEPHRDRITWDAPIHSVADIEALPFPPKIVNIKPSRFGSIRRLMDTYDYCEERGIGMYGGGQFELGVGRTQVQVLASLFHPNEPNDIAPTGYNQPSLQPGLPGSPLAPPSTKTGFH